MLIKTHPESVIPAMVVALVALLAIMAVPHASITCAAFSTVDVRQHNTFAGGLCPDPAKPVPVLTQNDFTGGGKTHFVKCISKGTPIVSTRAGFDNAAGRKDIGRMGYQATRTLYY